MATVQMATEQRLRFSGVSWDEYIKFSDSLPERRVRVTYDRGEMEAMTVSSEHEGDKSLLGRLVEALTEEMEIDIKSCGCMTCRREELQRGVEGDEGYWIEHEAEVRGKRHIDLDIDPPPDLFIEIEISRSALNRMAIFAALRIAEVWCWDTHTLRVFLLTAEGTYRPSDKSKAFPFLPLAEFAKFLRPTKLSETQLIRSFRAWVCEQIARGWSPAKGKGRRRNG
jgi:Uma2 family endonuclease